MIFVPRVKQLDSVPPTLVVLSTGRRVTDNVDETFENKEKGKPLKHLLNRVSAFAVSEEGTTATEYAVMLALIVVVCLVAITNFGTDFSNIFTNFDGNLSTGAVGWEIRVVHDEL
jgi:pilus assembly protein Flp/PilA